MPTSPVRAATMPTPAVRWARKNDRYLQNLAYLRLKNLTIGYTVPENLTRKIGISRARIYFSGENLCYWSPLKKHNKTIDPELAGSSGYEQGPTPEQDTPIPKRFP